MDWKGISTAILDRERVRLGLPSREEEMAARQKRDLEAQMAASQLETAGVGREKARAEIAAMPGEQDLNRRLREAQIANYGETTQTTRHLSKTVLKNGNVGVVDMDKGSVVDTGVPAQVKPAGGAGGGSDPKNGWSAQYGPDGKLVGYYHPAVGFRAVGSPSPGGGAPLPPNTRPTPLSAGERDALALGSVPIRAGETMGKALEATKAAEAASPWDPKTWTGPVAGRFGAGYRSMVDNSGPAGDFDQARAEGRALVYALSGKQINETEQAWLDGILPTLTNYGTPQQIERFNRFVGYLRAAKEKGYSDPFSVAQAQFDQTLPSEAVGADGGVGTSPASGNGMPPAGADPLEGRTATNAAGQKIVRKGGQWVPAQ